jgi:hypothetical protein
MVERRMGTLALVLCAACTSASPTISQSTGRRSAAAATSPSPSPSVAPKPKAADAPLVGTYEVKFILIHSNVNGIPQVDHGKWKFTPRCDEGACDATLKSLGGKYELKAGYVKGHYRWARNAKGFFTCRVGSSTTDMPTVQEVMLEPKSVRLINGRWVVSAFGGSEDAHSTRACSFLGTLEERSLLRGKLVSGNHV